MDPFDLLTPSEDKLLACCCVFHCRDKLVCVCVCFRLHAGGAGGDCPPAPDPKSTPTAWANTTPASHPSGHHAANNQQVRDTRVTTRTRHQTPLQQNMPSAVPCHRRRRVLPSAHFRTAAKNQPPGSVPAVEGQELAISHGVTNKAEEMTL